MNCAFTLGHLCKQDAGLRIVLDFKDSAEMVIDLNCLMNLSLII